MVYTERAETEAVSCGTSHASAVCTPLRWIFKTRYKKQQSFIQNHMRQRHSESALRAEKSAIYKSHHQSEKHSVEPRSSLNGAWPGPHPVLHTSECPAEDPLSTSPSALMVWMACLLQAEEAKKAAEAAYNNCCDNAKREVSVDVCSSGRMRKI